MTVLPDTFGTPFLPLLSFHLLLDRLPQSSRLLVDDRRDSGGSTRGLEEKRCGLSIMVCCGSPRVPSLMLTSLCVSYAGSNVSNHNGHDRRYDVNGCGHLSHSSLPFLCELEMSPCTLDYKLYENVHDHVLTLPNEAYLNSPHHCVAVGYTKISCVIYCSDLTVSSNDPLDSYQW